MPLHRLSDTVDARGLRSALINVLRNKQMSRIVILLFLGKEKKNSDVINRVFFVVIHAKKNIAIQAKNLTNRDLFVFGIGPPSRRSTFVRRSFDVQFAAFGGIVRMKILASTNTRSILRQQQCGHPGDYLWPTQEKMSDLFSAFNFRNTYE